MGETGAVGVVEVRVVVQERGGELGGEGGNC